MSSRRLLVASRSKVAARAISEGANWGSSSGAAVTSRLSDSAEPVPAVSPASAQ